MSNYQYEKGSSYSTFQAGIKQKIHSTFQKSYDTLPVRIKMLMDVSNSLGKGIHGDNMQRTKIQNVTDLCKSLYSDFLELKKDYADGVITKEKYHSYLNVFKSMIDAQLLLDTVAFPEFEVLAEIKKNNLI